MAKADQLSEQEAWDMPLEEIEARSEELGLLVGPVEEEFVREVLGPPGGVGLPMGVQGGDAEAFPDVGQLSGDHVIENRVTRRGLRRLKILRMGAPVEPYLYLAQVDARMGTRSIEKCAWIDKSGGQELHYLVIMWKED